MNRTVFTFFLGLLLISCELTYEDNRRLLLRGNINDPEESTMPDLPVEVYASGHFITPLFFFPFVNGTKEDVDLIGASKLYPDGTYKIVTISPENESNILVIVNRQGNEDYKNDWPSLFISGANYLPLEDSTYDLPQVELDKIIQTKLTITRQTNLTDTLYFNINYNSSYKELDLGEAKGLYHPLPEYSSTILDPDEDEAVITFKNIKSGTVRASYQLVNKGIVDEKIFEMEFDQEQNGYEFKF
ncbi:hypothetical protein [Flagellimonas nanhaiensis]|uniref:Uncharacterized protein n=1 Tax=Flagellimonas nanhaiensis TaxID=2292706 RepID=A0A371JQT0_9FLAO|nr:hypothetical protein [Allomuricauda nanhaiensis]RDY59871.1 hypothetical protein DX873_11000 [Allomuricauda nanhaiensis]